MIKLKDILNIINDGYCKLFSKNSRVNRLQYLKGNVILSLILMLFIEIIKLVNSLMPSKAFFGTLFVVSLILSIYYCGRAFIGRLHDIGLSSWYFFIILAIYNLISFKYPSFALVIIVFWHTFAFIFPGNKHTNKYGTISGRSDKNKTFIA